MLEYLISNAHLYARFSAWLALHHVHFEVEHFDGEWIVCVELSQNLGLDDELVERIELAYTAASEQVAKGRMVPMPGLGKAKDAVADNAGNVSEEGSVHDRQVVDSLDNVEEASLSTPTTSPATAIRHQQ